MKIILAADEIAEIVQTAVQTALLNHVATLMIVPAGMEAQVTMAADGDAIIELVPIQTSPAAKTTVTVPTAPAAAPRRTTPKTETVKVETVKPAAKAEPAAPATPAPAESGSKLFGGLKKAAPADPADAGATPQQTDLEEANNAAKVDPGEDGAAAEGVPVADQNADPGEDQPEVTPAPAETAEVPPAPPARSLFANLRRPTNPA